MVLGCCTDCVRRVRPWYWGVVQIVLEECVHGTGVLYRLC